MRNFYLFGLLSSFLGCASQDIRNKEYLQNTEKKLWSMDSRLEQQEKQLAQLNETLQEQRKAALAVKTETLAAPISPEVQKSDPPAILKTEFRDINEGEAIASSEHDEIQLYYMGLQHLRNERFAEAIKTLEQFISENPDHIYTDRAEYLLAEAHFKKQEFGKVLLSYQVFRDRFPYSLKLPNLQLLRALSLGELDQLENSEVALREILQEYPHHDVFEKANQKLAELKKSKLLNATAQP